MRILQTLVLWLAVACGTPATPDSLVGTDVDGALTFDAHGLVLDDDARRAFDYVLLAEGELDERQLEDWLEQLLAADGAADAEIRAALDGFARYRSYRAAVAAILTDEARSASAARPLVDAVIASELAGTPLADAEASRLQRAFAVREALDLADPVARAAALDALRGDDAAAFRSSPAGRYIAAREAVAADRAALPEAFGSFGDDAVRRLQAVREAREDFRRRVGELAGELDALPADEAREVLAQRLAERFSESERARVRGALARHGAGTP